MKRKRFNLDYKVPATIEFDAAPVDLVAAAENGRPTFRMRAYSGGLLFVRGFKHPVVVDLVGLEVNANANILLDHNSKQRVGHPTSIDVTNEINAAGIISAENEHADEVINSAKNEFRWHASIGARILEASEVPAGRTVTVNGRTFTGPVIVASKSKLNEISFVGAGGDEDNQVTIAAAASIGDDDMTKFEQWLVDKKIEADGLSDTVLATLEASFDAETKAAETKAVVPDVPKGGDDDTTATLLAEMRATTSAESKRIAAIRKICGTQWTEIEAEALEQGWDATATELAVLRAEREKPDDDPRTGPFIQVPNMEPATESQAIEASLCMQFGISEESAASGLTDKAIEAAQSPRYKSVGLHYLIYKTLSAAGKYYRPGVMDDETIRDFMRAEQTLEASAPGSLSHQAATGILSNVANKSLLNAFNMVNRVIPTIFGRKSVRDFKLNTAYRLVETGELEEIKAGGVIRHLKTSEESFTNQLKQWGKMLTLDRKDIINDDLSAFAQIPADLGRKSAIKLEKEGFKKLLNPGGSFYSTDNNKTGAGTALSITSLSTAEQAMMDQTNAAGEPILLTPTYLVTGTALKRTAMELMDERTVVVAGTTDLLRPAVNTFAGDYQPLASPWMNAQSLTNGSAKIWFLIASPSDEAAFAISYLNGRTEPVIESSDLHFDRLGISWRVVFDFGVDTQERRAVINMKGEA